jgi:hypothetical protein
MEMNTSRRLEGLWETDHGQERRGNPGVDAAPQELCADAQTPPRSPPGPYVPDGGASETFLDGTGI